MGLCIFNLRFSIVSITISGNMKTYRSFFEAVLNTFPGWNLTASRAEYNSSTVSVSVWSIDETASDVSTIPIVLCWNFALSLCCDLPYSPFQIYSWHRKVYIKKRFNTKIFNHIYLSEISFFFKFEETKFCPWKYLYLLSVKIISKNILCLQWFRSDRGSGRTILIFCQYDSRERNLEKLYLPIPLLVHASYTPLRSLKHCKRFETIPTHHPLKGCSNSRYAALCAISVFTISNSL